MELRYWHDPVETRIKIMDEKEETGSLHIDASGSYAENGVGSAVVIFVSGQHIKSVKSWLNKK